MDDGNFNSSSNGAAQGFVDLNDALVDLDREKRCGFSEVIYGEGKTADSILRIALAQLERGIDVLATRVDAQKAAAKKAGIAESVSARIL